MVRARREPLGWRAVAIAGGANLLLLWLLAQSGAAPSPRRGAAPPVMQELFAPEAVPDAVHAVPPRRDDITAPPNPEPHPAPASIPDAPALDLQPRVDLGSLPMPVGEAPLTTLPAWPGLPAATAPMVDAAERVLGIGDVDVAPHRLSAPLPPYPAWARRGGLEAVVHLRLLIGRDGSVEQAEVERVHGDDRFGAIATAAVRDWRFEPARLADRTVRCTVLQRVMFQLEAR